MLIRFNRSAAVRKAYAIYDDQSMDVDKLHKKLTQLLTKELEDPSADPELRLLRGKSYAERDLLPKALSDWQACEEDPHVGGLAHLYIGFLYITQLPNPAARPRFESAIRLGWVEGHVGLAEILRTDGFQLRDEANRPDAAAEAFQQAIEESTRGSQSPNPWWQARALRVRANMHYALGNTEAFASDKLAEKAVSPVGFWPHTDPRASGSDHYE